jgi:hypothetical protein
MKMYKFCYYPKKDIFNFLKRPNKNLKPDIKQEEEIKNEKINQNDNKDKKDQPVQKESKINKYFRDDIKRYDGRLN